ncbi:metal-binding protein ZinT [Paracoccus aminophilus]|uniref:ZinT domain-containing protein n=1 Tax=Paracoccus aminophilus JCM 7686 TaxID=1367847 RepID=S5Y098_PARAH|nr:metal-binding protein ZinT [Paracoccus aminophilus]AGT10962.1 hypothetical protein JCM7686_pAMI4p272 [Paracoccus aminophilus JCM 7686]
MQQISFPRLGALVLASALLTGPAFAQTKPAAAEAHAHDHAHSHSHDHAHQHDTKGTVAQGYFEDAAVKARSLGDWAGDWQSVYPYLENGTLDPVMAHKAEHGDKSAAEYRAYYEAGYKTATDRITITGDRVEFISGDQKLVGQYAEDGHEILTYPKGNRGVRFIFKKIAGDAKAPAFIQFSDHIIAPEKAGHFHLYWGDDRQALLGELDHWPTYYPAGLSGDQIRAEMLAH